MDHDLSPSAVALQRVLDAGGEPAEQIKTKVHRTVLWKWLNGKRLPDLASAALLEELTGGEVSAVGWNAQRRGERDEDAEATKGAA